MFTLGVQGMILANLVRLYAKKFTKTYRNDAETRTV